MAGTKCGNPGARVLRRMGSRSADGTTVMTWILIWIALSLPIGVALGVFIREADRLPMHPTRMGQRQMQKARWKTYMRRLCRRHQ